MDTYRMHAGYSVPAVVTGKPLSVGGSLGRNAATGRGCAVVALEACRRLGRDPHGMTVAVQGFGNVGQRRRGAHGGATASRIRAVVGQRRGDLQRGRARRRTLWRHKARTGSVVGFPGTEPSPTPSCWRRQWTCSCPPRWRIRSRANAGRVKATLILEGANGPTTPDADEILYRRGIMVVPDIVANAGGVTVSYFEWVQDLQSFFWEEDEINQRLAQIMRAAFDTAWEHSERLGVPLRLGAYAVAVQRVADATLARGFYP